MISFAGFLLATRTPSWNLKLKDKLKIWGFESFIFWSKFRFLGLSWGCFSQFTFNFFHHYLNTMTIIFTQPPLAPAPSPTFHHKTDWHGPDIWIKLQSHIFHWQHIWESCLYLVSELYIIFVISDIIYVAYISKFYFH